MILRHKVPDPKLYLVDMQAHRAWQCRRHKRCRFNSWIRKNPLSRNGNSLHYSCLENSTDRVWPMGSQRTGYDWVTKTHTQGDSWIFCLTWIALSLTAQGTNEIIAAVTYKFAQPRGRTCKTATSLARGPEVPHMKSVPSLSCSFQLVSIGISYLKARTCMWRHQENPLPWCSRTSLQLAKLRPRKNFGIPFSRHTPESQLFQHRTGEMSIKLGNTFLGGGV